MNPNLAMVVGEGVDNAAKTFITFKNLEILSFKLYSKVMQSIVVMKISVTIFPLSLSI